MHDSRTIFHFDVPNNASLCSRIATNSFMHNSMDSVSVRSLCTWRIIKLLRRASCIVASKNDFILLSADTLLSLTAFVHYMKVWIYNVFTTIQMWCKCVCKYCICDISAIVNESLYSLRC